VIVNISGNTFANNIIDIRVIGSWSRTGESGGDNNMAKVVIKDGDSTTLTIDFHDCYPEDAFPICNSEAKVTFIDN